MASPGHFFIADRAVEAMEREAQRWPDQETGGILLGYRQAGRTTVTHATGPGPRATHAPLAFVQDTPYQQQVLDYLSQAFRVNYLGVWHKHPPDIPYPSQGDIQGAWQDIADPDIPGDELLIPICTLREGKVQLTPYLAQEEGCTPVEWHTVPFAGLLTGQWYESPLGKQRAAQESAQLRAAGAHVQVRRTPDGNYNFYATLHPWRSLVFGCPQDYPVSPPQVALWDATTGAFSPAPIPGLASWDFASTLAALYQGFPCTHSPTRPRTS